MTFNQHLIINLTAVAFVALDFLLYKLIMLIADMGKTLNSKRPLVLWLIIGFSLLAAIMYLQLCLWNGMYHLQGVTIIKELL